MLWTRAVRRAPMTPLRLVLAGAAGSAAADFGDQDPRGLTHTVIGSLEDFAVDCHRHAFLDLAAEAVVPAVELEQPSVADRRSGDQLSAMPEFTDSPVEGG